MSIINDIFGAKPINKNPNDTEEKKKRPGQISKQLTLEQLDRAKADIDTWRNGLEEWEDLWQPDRTTTVTLYNEIIMDNVVAVFIENLKNRILQTELFLTSDGETEVETDIFMKGWYEKLVYHFVLSELFGYRLVELSTRRDNDIKIFHVPDHYLIPTWRKIMPDESTFTGLISYDPRPYNVIAFGDEDSKGLLNDIAVQYIYKKNALAYWSNYQSKFGVPPIIAKTDLTNEGVIEDLENFLKAMKSNYYAIVDREDEIEGLKTNQSEGFNTFLTLIELLENMMIRRLEGQNMTSQDGSSYAQANVHERTGDIWFNGRLNKFLRVANEQIVPYLKKQNIIKEKEYLAAREDKDIDKLIDRSVKLSQAGFYIDEDFIEENTGIKLADTPGSTMTETKDIYNKL